MTDAGAGTSQVGAKRRNWSVLAGVIAIVVVGGLVGTKAGNLAHRAPRGAGPRVAIIAANASASTAALDAVFRDLQRVDGQTTIPPLVLESKRLAMLRGGIDDATPVDAAEVLDADVVVHVAASEPAAAIQEARATLKLANGALPITTSPAAYDAFIEAEGLAQKRGEFERALLRYETATALDPEFAEAWAMDAWAAFSIPERTPIIQERIAASIERARKHPERLRPVSSLLVDAMHAWLAHDAAAPDLQPALREPAIAACRALTVRFPEERNGHLILGRAYRELFKGPTEGLRHLEGARRLTPEYFPITHQLVITWLQIGDRKHATQALRGFLATVGDEHAQAKEMLKALDTPM